MENVHGVNAKRTVVLKPAKDKVTCVFCDKSYANAFSLQRHIQTIHLFDETTQKLYSCSKCKYKTPHKHNLVTHIATHSKDISNSPAKIQMLKCLQCKAQFASRKNLNRHKKRVHGIKVNRFNILRKCPICSFSSSMYQKKDIHKHYEVAHNFSMKWEHHEFNSLDTFQDWKRLIEKTTVASFVKSRTMAKGHFVYNCNRCGTYKKSGKNLRHTKIKGSCKINFFCPSEIKVKQLGETIQVKYLATHVGHANEIEFTRLSFQDRKNIAQKLINKVPKKEILRSVRATLSSRELQRLHLTNAADIDNIKASLNLQDDWRKHPSDVLSTEAWLTELKQSNDTSVLVYKAQGCLNEQFSEFQENDFLLIYMTKVQNLVLTKHGKNTVCVDSTFGLNNYNFQMYTILTLDEAREGFPVAFMFTNRSDELALTRFYTEIQKASGTISTKTFMSDMDETLYSAWAKVMGPAEKRLFCAWHVIRALKKNIKIKIKNKEEQHITSSVVLSLVYEREEAAFFKILEQFILKIRDNEHTKLFYEYFNEYYLKNEKYKQWAYCFRLHSGINTNMSLENFNKVLKYYYLQGKRVPRMDQAIFAVVSLIRDKNFDLIIKKIKGKITTKLRHLRQAHKRSLAIDPNHVSATSDHEWQVLSSKQTELYSVVKVKNCQSCQLQCTHCGTCFHEFLCSCHENAIKNNMCKHIHAVCRSMSATTLDLLRNNTRSEFSEELSVTSILKEQTKLEDQTFEVKTEELFEEFKSMLTTLRPKICNNQQLDFLKKSMTTIDSVVQALGTGDHKEMEVQSLAGTSKNIPQQRRFLSTKKKHLKKKKPLNREAIIAHLLLD